MFHPTRPTTLPVGLDIGAGGVKLLQVRCDGEQLHLAAADRQPLPDGADPAAPASAAVAELVGRMLRQSDFAGRSVAAALPRGIVHVKTLRLPPMPPTELKSAVELEAAELFPFDPADAEVRHLAAGEVRQGGEPWQEVIVLAAKRAEIDRHLEALHRAGVAVASLDHEPLALYRAAERFVRRRQDEAAVHVLVEVGLRRTQVVIGRGRDVGFVRAVEIGGRHFDEAVTGKLGISAAEASDLRRRMSAGADVADAANRRSGGSRDPVRRAVLDATRGVMEALAKELSLCLRYYSVTFRGQRPAKVALVGGEGGNDWLRSILAATLSIPVECGRPLANVNLDRMKLTDRRGSLGEWTVALGLALRQAKGSFAGTGPMTGLEAARDESESAAPQIEIAAEKPAEAVVIEDLKPLPTPVRHAPRTSPRRPQSTAGEVALA